MSQQQLFHDEPPLDRKHIARRLDEIIAQITSYNEQKSSKLALRLLKQLRNEVAT